MKLVSVSAGAAEASSSRRLGDKLADATIAALADVGCQASYTRIELHRLAGDIAQAMVSREVSVPLAEAFDAILDADGLIAVSPVYNASYSGLFKSFFDVMDPRSLIGRPVLAGATGGSARHSLMVEHAMLPMFYFLKAELAPTPVFAASVDWADPSELDFRIARAAGSFARVVMAARPAKELPRVDVPSYDDLLTN